jgi:hypothetical protein
MADEQALSLDTIKVCDFELAYQDKGSGADKDLAIYRPHAPVGYYLIGDYIQGSYKKADGCTLAIKPASNNAESLLIAPGTWEQVWNDKGSGANMDGSIWRALPPNQNYVCLGSVGQTGYQQPAMNNYRCVHQCLVESRMAANSLWSDAGSGAKHRVSLYSLGNSGLFYGKSDRNQPNALLTLKSNPVCNNDAQVARKSPTKKKQMAVDKPREKKGWVDPDTAESAPSNIMLSTEWIKDAQSGCAIFNKNPQANEAVSWSGDCVNGKASGKGKIQWYQAEKLTSYYEGEMKEGQYHGYGAYTSANAGSYEGNYKYNKFQGHGTLTYADGSRYQGDWKDNKRQGHGVLIYADSSRYEGPWENDLKHGIGIYVYSDGRTEKVVYEFDRLIQ